MYVCPCSVAPINVCHTFILKGKESLFWTLKVKKKKNVKKAGKHNKRKDPRRDYKFFRLM